jgi:bifunctional DNA-binding transcriptional regulator/antitoxin component of YhaV-PrlF toxin-antitoxin module
MVTVVSLTAKNQLTLPTSLTEFLGLEKGTKLWTKVVGKSLLLEKIDESWNNLQGILAETKAAKKYTPGQVIKIAEKKEAKRLAKI